MPISSHDKFSGIVKYHNTLIDYIPFAYLRTFRLHTLALAIQSYG